MKEAVKLNKMSSNISNEEKDGLCPICNKTILLTKIEDHVNRCIFLNCEDSEKQKKKRSLSPSNYLEDKEETNFPLSPKLPKLGIQSNVKTIYNKPSTSTNIKNEDTKKNFTIPLAKQMQPKHLDEFFGQNHVLGKNSVLRNLLEKQEIPNMILWGPPGCGKTSLSAVIGEICKKNSSKWKFSTLCAATSGVKEVQNVISIAKNDMKFGRRTVLFMDEIHRFNKKQQDIFLMSVERGEIVLIGATTENPSFYINNALLSRCRVITMEKLEVAELFSIVEKTAKKFNIDIINDENADKIINNNEKTSIKLSALQWLVEVSDGDARIALNNFQLVMQNINDSKKIIEIDDVKEAIQRSHILYDRGGEEHYNIISAVHKSIRGSDANAALYWTTRMIVGGEDPMFIARRLVRAASEDIGNADPNALMLAVATMQGCHFLGKPESDCLLAQCAIYLARAPKSREADSALAAAKKVIEDCKGAQPSVPMHIRNAPTRLMKDLGYGKLQPGMKRTFLPPELDGVNFFS